MDNVQITLVVVTLKLKLLFARKLTFQYGKLRKTNDNLQ